MKRNQIIRDCNITSCCSQFWSNISRLSTWTRSMALKLYICYLTIHICRNCNFFVHLGHQCNVIFYTRIMKPVSYSNGKKTLHQATVNLYLLLKHYTATWQSPLERTPSLTTWSVHQTKMILLITLHITSCCQLKKSDRTDRLAQWWERSLVSQVRFPDPASYVGWVCCWFSTLLREVFSPGTPVFPSPQKPTFLNSNSIWTSGTLVMSPWLGWLRKHSLCLTLNLHLHFDTLMTLFTINCIWRNFYTDTIWEYTS